MWLPSDEDIKNYLLLKEMLRALRVEFDLLSKKKTDVQLNQMKIKMINRVLEPLNELFKNERSHKFLDIPDVVDIPTNSDIVLIISQYEKAIQEFKEKYYFKDDYLKNSYGDSTWRWMTKEKPSSYFIENEIEDENAEVDE